MIKEPSAERWQKVSGFDGYEVSTFGRVKSVARKKGWCMAHEKFLKPWHLPKGYLVVSLSKDGKKKHCQIHRLVADAFIPNLDNKPQVNHKNGDKTDNRVENLEWATNCENHIHKVYNLGVNSVSPTRKVECVNTGVVYSSVHNAARAIGKPSAYSAIASVARGERKKAQGLKWRYLDGD